MAVTKEQILERRQLINQLRALETPEAVQDADNFETLLHNEQTNLLAEDVYGAAKGHLGSQEERTPPIGWTRGSENLDALRSAIPGLKDVNDAQILDMLKPNDSGFRAEIYLPDPAVLGENFKPVIVPKGSGGEVLFTDRNGSPQLRDTTNEDFLANNFNQAIGQETDYYDRAMELAVFMQRAGFNGEFGGHSLSGGMCSAMSAVTGLPATTVNAAGLHPDTALRFAQQNPSVKVHDTGDIVTAFQIKGELLNDGVQNNMERRDIHERRVLGSVLGETAKLVQSNPLLRQRLEDKLLNDPNPHMDMPEHAKAAVKNFLDRVANGDTQKMLDELPLAAGTVHILEQPMTRDNGALVRRQDHMQLAEATVLAIPLMEVAGRALTNARAGASIADVPAKMMASHANFLDVGGDAIQRATAKVADFQDVSATVVRTAGGASATSVGELAAGSREKLGQLEARIDETQGRLQQGAANAGARGLRFVGGFLPDSVEKTLTSSAESLERYGRQAAKQNAEEATRARTRGEEGAEAIRQKVGDVTASLSAVHLTTTTAQSEALRSAGRAANAVWDAVSNIEKRSAEGLPLAGAAAGGIVGAFSEGIQRTREAMSPAKNVASMGSEAARQMFPTDDSNKASWSEILQSSDAAKLVKDITGTGRLISQGGNAAGEAVERHLEAATLAPTFEAMAHARQAELQKIYGPAIELNEAITARTKFENNPLVDKVRQAVAAAEQRMGKVWDESSERLTASVSVLAYRNGFRAGDDLTVSFNPQTATYRASEMVQITRSGPTASADPHQNRVHMTTSDAIAAPAHTTYANYDKAQIDNQHSQRDVQQEQEQQRVQSAAMTR